MEKAGVISDYLDALASALSFDRSLSRRVRQEVEDHLWDVVAADQIGDREAERRAVANFGDPQVLAAQFAVVSLAKQTKRVGVALILVIACSFAAMKARVAWYAALQWALSEDIRPVGAVIGSIDRYSFRLSVIIGLGALAYIGSQRTPLAFDSGYRRQLRRSFYLCAATTAFLIVSVISDGTLTVLQMFGAELSAKTLLPIVSMAVEIACAGFLVFQIHGIAHRVRSTAALLKT